MRGPFLSNEESLRDAFAAFNEGDLDTLVAFIHPAIRWETSGIFPGLDSVYEGRDGIRRFWADFMDPWEEISIEPLEISEPLPDRLVAHVRIVAKGDQGDVDIELWQVYFLRDTALVNFRAYPGREPAFAAAVRAAA